jgi:hypothetical protein
VEVEKITQEQAEAALSSLTGETPEPSPVVETAAPEPSVAEVAAEPVAEEPTAGEPEVDDVTSLKKRLEDYEAKVAEKEKLHESRWKAFQDRASQNEQILRERYLRKSSTADRALKILKATRSEQGVPETDVDTVIREIESTMNPQSASYAPPPQPTGATEDQAITLNAFLNEKGMTAEEANEFGNWVRSEGAAKLTHREQAVAEQSLDGFLRIAHNRYAQDMSEQEKQSKRNDAVEAVKSVQRTQKDAARAASSAPTAPRKSVSTSGGKSIDIHKMPENERNEFLSDLIRRSAEEYR